MKKRLYSLIFWCSCALLWETEFHLVVWRELSAGFLWTVPFCLSLGVFFSALSGAWPWRLANRITGFVLLCLTAFIFCVQTVYQYIFGALLSLSLVGQGGEAISHYFGVMMDAIFHCLPYILLYFLPVPVLAVLYGKGVLDGERTGAYWETMALCASVLIFAVGVPSMGGGNVRSSFYYSTTSTIDEQARLFGLVTGERLELSNMVKSAVGSDGGADSGNGWGDEGDLAGIKTDVFDLTASTGGGEAAERNVMDAMDLDALTQLADTSQRYALSKYFSNLSGTAKNEYTGLCEGFNVIEICAESFWYYLPDPVRTPTLYKLTHEGIVFDNFYCSFAQTTTNGEYSMCMGLLPDFNRMSFNIAAGNYLPFTLGNELKKLGVEPKAYHDYTVYLYGRITSHPNMGYELKGIETGLDMSVIGSDVEMFEKTVDEYIDEDRFMVHYMTYSGHLPYNFETDKYAIMHQDEVADMDADEAVKAYFAANMELEHALTYLLERLEEKGILDRTLIIMTGDHFPYALSEDQQKSVAGDEVGRNPYWMYRNNFVCWSGAFKETVHVEAPCCTQDILPTVLNLLNIEYDSRLMTGTDALSDCTHVAVLQTKCFITEDFIYSFWTGIKYLTPEEELPPGYAEEIIEAVLNEFSVAAAVLRSDYYGFAYEALDIDDVEIAETDEATFLDTIGKFYKDSVNHLAQMGVVVGDNYVFRGDQPATLSEFAKMVAMTLDMEVPEVEEIPVAGLTKSSWQYDWIMALWDAGVLRDGSCDLIGSISLDEAREYARRLGEHYGEYSDEICRIMDRAIAQTEEMGLPDEGLTRGATAYFAYSVYKLIYG